MVIARARGRKMSWFSRLLLFLILLPGLAVAEGAAWEPVHVETSLQVHRRPYAGSELLEIRGVLRVQATLNARMGLLRDADFNRHWVYRSGGARILRENGYRQAWVYGVVDAPWPMRDRDTVVRFDYRQHPDSRVIHIAISNFPDFTERVDGYVRVPDFGGFWELRPQPAGWVQVTYQVYGCLLYTSDAADDLVSV